MSEIQIEGVISTQHLKRGETATVERTDLIDTLLEEGYVREVRVDAPAPAEPVSSPVVAASDVTAPSRSGSTEEWAAFVASLGIPVAEGASRAELINSYDEYATEMTKGDGEG